MSRCPHCNGSLFGNNHRRTSNGSVAKRDLRKVVPWRADHNWRERWAVERLGHERAPQ